MITNETRLYFAYGMNLNHALMAKACPTAMPIGPRKIQGYQIVFRQYADIIESHPDDYIWGGCWLIDTTAEKALDRIEGYPYLYDKVEINEMMVYQMDVSDNTEIEPSLSYVTLIREGLIDFGLPPKTLEENCTPTSKRFLKSSFDSKPFDIAFRLR